MFKKTDNTQIEEKTIEQKTNQGDAEMSNINRQNGLMIDNKENESYERKNNNNDDFGDDTKAYINDTASEFSDMSRFTGYVSTIGQDEYQASDVLVAIIGVGEYHGLPT